MPATYEPIASTTVSAAADVTFSSIPGTYTDLVFIYSGTATSGPHLFQFNGDTGTNYSDTHLLGNGTAATSSRYSSQGAVRVEIDPTTGQHVVKVSIMSYSNTNVFKTTLSEAANAATRVERLVGLWRSTAAITLSSFLVTARDLKSSSGL